MALPIPNRLSQPVHNRWFPSTTGGPQSLSDGSKIQLNLIESVLHANKCVKDVRSFGQKYARVIHTYVAAARVGTSEYSESFAATLYANTTNTTLYFVRYEYVLSQLSVLMQLCTYNVRIAALCSKILCIRNNMSRGWFERMRAYVQCDWNNRYDSRCGNPSFVYLRNTSSSTSYITPLLGGGCDDRTIKRHKKIWNRTELKPYLMNEAEGVYFKYVSSTRASGLTKAHDAYALAAVPLSELINRLSGKNMESLCRLHDISFRSHSTSSNLANLLNAHVCIYCDQVVSMFSKYDPPLSENQRGKMYRSRNVNTLRAMRSDSYAKIKADPEYKSKRKIKDRLRHYRSSFPPKPPSEALMRQVINEYCRDIEPDRIKESGCAVCGQLTPLYDLTKLSDTDIDLTPLSLAGVTRKERREVSDPIEDVKGPVLATGCTSICSACVKSFRNGKLPHLSLANGLWVGDVPKELRELSWSEQRMISRVMYNYCIVRLWSGGHKMRANAVQYPVPIPRVYSVLPPKREDMDDVLAFLYIGSSSPNVEQYRRTPFLVRHSKIRAALEWLKLNHIDYADVEISYSNLAEYPENEPPVWVNFHKIDPEHPLKDSEATAVNDMEAEDGTTEGDCPFIMNTLTSDQLSSLLDEQNGYETIRAKAASHFARGNKVLGVGHGSEMESIYNNPQLYPQMFPHLFPYGYGGLGNARGWKNVSDTKRKTHLLMYHDKRFQTDPAFALIAFNHEQIKNCSTGAFLMADRQRFDEIANRFLEMDICVLDKIIDRLEEDGYFKAETAEEKDVYKVLSDLDFVNSHVDGSITNLKRKRDEIWSLTAYLGAPSWFITFSPADTNHPIAIYYADGSDAIYPDFKEYNQRIRLISKNPVAGARFFKTMVELFLKHVLGVDSDHAGIYGQTAGYYGTVEQQGRLTLHMHLLLWLKRALTPQEIRDKILDTSSTFQKRFIEYIESVHVGDFCTGSMSHVEETVADKLKKNPNRLKATVRMPTPAPEPCRSLCKKCAACVTSADWWGKFYEEVDELILDSNVHDCTKSKGCKILVRVGKNIEVKCKARFPQEIVPTTMFDKDDGAIKQRKLEAWINWFNPIMTYLLRCNTDLTSLLSGTAIKAVIAYVTNYITKPALKTYTIFAAIKSTYVKNTELLNSDYDRQAKARKVITKIVNALTAKSEIGSPMACMYLLKHPDHYTSHKFAKFYWRSFVREVEQAWGIKTEYANGKPADMVVLSREDNKLIPLCSVFDYVYRPSACEHMTLYDWIRRATKERMSKTMQQTVAKEGEYVVERILAHQWTSRRSVKFLVLWEQGDKTWESYGTCRHLAAMDIYLHRHNIDDWHDLPKATVTDVGNDSDEIEDNSSVNVPDELEAMNNSQIHTTTEGTYLFMADHPQAKTHRVRIRSESNGLVPDFKGATLPRRDRGNREDYCMTMLTLFKPWRTGRELKRADESWDSTFLNHQFTERQNELFKFFHLKYECLDARDDYSAQLRAGKIKGPLPLGLSKELLQDLSQDEAYYPEDVAPEMSSADLEDVAHEYAVPNHEMQNILAKMSQAERLLETTGLLDDINYKEEISVVRDDGDAHSGSEWHQLLMARKEQILDDRRASVVKRREVDKYIQTQQKDVDVVKTVDQGYFQNTYVPADKRDVNLIADTIRKFSLNDEQTRAFTIVANHATTSDSEPLQMHLGGMAGSGKSQVIRALTDFFEQRDESYRFMCLAPTGAAASLINGSTYHSVLGFNGYGRTSMSSLAQVYELLKDVDYIFIDEVSMLGCTNLYQISARMAIALHREDVPFGGKNMIFAGDFAQLPPAGGGYPLYSGSISSTAQTTGTRQVNEAPMGKSLWHQFTTVVMLRQNMRQATQSEEDARFRVCLENLRYKACTPDDIALLRARIVGPGPNDPKLTDPNFRNAPIITRWNAYRDKLNDLGCTRFARERNQPIQTFYAEDEWTTQSVDDSNNNKRKRKHMRDPMRKSSEIPPQIKKVLWDVLPSNSDNHPGKIRICLGLPVVIRKNRATECGVTNGAEGIVVGWKTRQLDKDHVGLDTVFVELANKELNIQIEGLPKHVVPVHHVALPIVCKFPNGDKRTVKRDQIPLIPNFASTDYGAQGRTRQYNVVDLNSFQSHQAIYTALTRGTSYRGTLIIQGFDSRYMTGGIAGNLRQEYRELELLDEMTRLRFEGDLPKHIIGTRNFQIYLYRLWKGERFMPETMPRALQWSAHIPYDNDEPKDELVWQLLRVNDNKRENGAEDANNPASQKLSHSAIAKKLKQHNYVPAEGSKRYDNIRLTDDIATEGGRPNKRIRTSAPGGRVYVGPQGITWNAINFSCAYDSLFTILFNVYRSWSPETVKDCKLLNDEIKLLCDGFAAVTHNRTTLENARDDVRVVLHRLNRTAYPLLGRTGASVPELCEDMFRDRNPYVSWRHECARCEITIDEQTCNKLLWYISKPSWKQSAVSQGNIRSAPISVWIEKMRNCKTQRICSRCTRNTVKRMILSKAPVLIPVVIQEGVKPIIERIINIDDTQYRLCGVIYFGGAHWTCRVIEVNGDIWYHDGISTKNKCNYEGNLDVYNMKNLWKCKQNRTCSVILYAITTR